jgi:hypothetical protein
VLLWVLRQFVGSDASTLLPRLAGRGVGWKVDPDYGPRRVSIPCQGRDSVCLELSWVLQLAIARGQWVTIDDEAEAQSNVRVRYEFSFNDAVVGEAVVTRIVYGGAAEELYRGRWSLLEGLRDLPSAALH